jgi:hypothetical protein
MESQINRRTFWLLLALLPLQALALGGANFLVKPKDLKPTEGYMLFSMLYLKSDMPGETPCIQIELNRVSPKGKKKSQFLTTDTGWHCDTAWTNTEAVVQEDGIARLVFLAALPAGEYEISKGFIQYSRSIQVIHSNPGVVGFGRIQVTDGKLAYAGAFRLLLSSGRALIAAGDLWAKDSELLKKLRPDLDASSVVMASWTDPSVR